MKPNQLLLMTLIFLLMLAGGAGQTRAADAVVGDGSPASCTEAAFDSALATAVVGDILLTGVTFNFLVAFKFVTMLTTFILGGLGWFLGDLIQGYLFLKQTGAKWRSR